MLIYLKKYWITSSYNEYGQLMGEILAGQLVVGIHDYFQLKQKYFKTQEQLENLGLCTPALEDWVRFTGGWSKKNTQSEL